MGVYDDKPWLKSYDDGVDGEIDIPDISLAKFFVDTASAYPDMAAFHYMGETAAFAELLELSGRFATFLHQRGLGKGDVLAVNLPNTPQYLVAAMGALRAGVAVSGLAPLLMPEEIVYQLNDSKAKILLILDLLFEPKFAPVSESTPDVELVLLTGLNDFSKAVTDYPQGKPLEGKRVASFMKIIEDTDNNPPDISVSSNDDCFIQYTGGTTGPPKGAVLSHSNMVSNICQFEVWMHVERGKELFVSGFPMFHLAGLFVAMCGLCWAATQVLIPDPRNTDHIIAELDKYRPSFLANVPSLFLLLLARDEFRKLDFSNIKNCFSGAAPFPKEAIRDLESVVGEDKTVEVWGMTETSPLITVNPARRPSRVGSVGLPLPNTAVRVVDIDDGETEMPIGREGELICSGPQVMKGYLNRPEETENALREHDGRVWMHTGDVGRMDEEGFFHVVDRAKDMIIVGGYKVFSSEVEDKLYKHPAIAMCALVGLPNPDRPDSEIVKLIVQKSPDYKDMPDNEVQDEIIAFAKENFAPYKVPKIVEFTDAIPVTSVGKVDKKALR